MKSYINLLPKEDQKEIALERTSVRVLNLFVWVLISLGVVILFLFAARFYLKSELTAASSQIELQRQVVSQEDNRNLKIQLQNFNADLGNLIKLDTGQAIWSEVMIGFARLIPADVAIDTFFADRETGKVRVTGFAKTRESVLVLRNNILGSPYFTNVNFPLSNLIKPVNVDFYYTFYVKPEELLKK